ncbi:M56 family metallopeptidase [Pontibacter harenae]|uniref:M56 family metallopeptidase n=1 Tax=Pontibacter harenae TaxID=2894083 RepID=UPI001E28ADD0|nr:M56 family metallopeptidase [Pontibacter harenae]MCC9166710.1 M56 family metallopeptidase [Pontibacter harenae]
MNSNLPQYLLESGVCLAAFYLLYLVALRKETSFQYNRFYLLAAVAISFLLPLLQLPLLPQQTAASFQPIVSQLAPFVIYASAEDAAEISRGISWPNIVLMVYAIGCCFFIYRFLHQLYGLYQFIRQHQTEITRWNGISLINTNGRFSTFSFLNYIFWNNSQPLNQAEREQVLQHEAVHVRQGHSFDMLFLELLQIVFWFNPLLLLYKKALISTHEFIADAQVLRQADRQAYAHLLAKQVCLKMEFAIGNYFNKSLTLKRMKMIQTQKHHTSFARKIAALPLLACLLFVFSCDSLAEEPNDLQEITVKGFPSEQAIKTPEFPGGEKEMLKFMGRNMRYPKEAQADKIVGYVVIQATVDEKGKLGNYKTVQAPGQVLEQAVITTLNKMPAWEPALQNGKAIPSTYLFTVNFLIKGEDKEISESAKPDLESITGQLSAQAPKQPVYVASDIVVVGYGVSKVK